MPSLDYIVIFIFTLMILLAGTAFTRSGSDMKSFFAAGGALPWWLSGLSLFMSFFSAGTFVVWGSIAYEHGWVAITIQWAMGIGGFLVAFYIAPRWRKTGVLTVGEYIGQRFGAVMQQFYSYTFLVISFVTAGAFLYPVAKLFNVSTGFSIELSVVLLGILIILYTAAGGLWAVIITDVLQFVILFAAVFMVIPLAFGEIGGFEAFISRSPEGFYQLFAGEYTLGFLIAFAFYNTFFIGGNWAYVQRYTSVSTPQAAKKVGLLFGGLYLISPVLWMIPPMIFRALDGNLVGLENEGAYLLMCKQVLPAGMLGLMLGGMIFATASSVNTTLNMSAAVFTNDIFKKLFSTSSTSTLMRVARISTAIFGLVTIGVALMVPKAGGIVEVVLSFGAITGVPLYGPPIWTLFSNRQTTFSIASTTLISIAINLFFKFLSPLWLGISLNRAEEMAVGVGTPLVLLAGFELYQVFRGKENTEHTPKEAMPSTSNAQGQPDTGQNLFAFKVMGICLSFTGLLIGGLGISAREGIVIGIGMLVLALGGWLLKISQGQSEKTPN